MFRVVAAVLLVLNPDSCSAAHVQGEMNLAAPAGQTVTLPCRAPSSAAVWAAEWSRPDLEPRYVFFYRDAQPDATLQDPTFRGRVRLADARMKDGDLSLVLENVTSSDTGTYECRVKQGSAAQAKRAVIQSEPISTVHLVVTRTRETLGLSGNGRRAAADLGLCLFISAAMLLI